MDGEFDPFRDAKGLWTRLWREIYGEPPPLADDPQLLSRILVESLPQLPPYEIGKLPPRDPDQPLTASKADPSD
jgi:hypothetical protein